MMAVGRQALASLYAKVAHFSGDIHCVGIGQIRRLDDVADHSELHRRTRHCCRTPVDNASRVTPDHLLGQVWRWIKDKQLDKEKLKELRANSPLGEILAAGLANSSTVARS